MTNGASLFSSRSTYTAADVSVGDIVAYPVYARPRNERDWLLVTRIDKGNVYGTRVYPQDWEVGQEYAVIAAQIEARGLAIAE